VAARDLNVGTHLQTKTESWLSIDKVETHTGLTTVYNFEVAGFHTYFVSDIGLLVHNNCGIANPKNLIRTQTPVEMTGSKIKRLSKNMKENGFDPSHPIEVAEVNGTLLIKDGNHRAAAAISRGINEVPYVKVKVTPEEEASLLLGAANALNFRRY
jgi:ParB-like nuclease domain